MKVAVPILAVCLLSLFAVSEAQVLNQRKPGLWELQYTTEGGPANQEQARMAERLKNMSPDKRAQMEAYMKERGMSAGGGPGGTPMGTMRFCLTPQDIAEESAQGLLKSLKRNGECTSKIVSQSPHEIHVQAQCQAQDGSHHDVDARVFDVAPDHYSVDMKGIGARGDVNMQQKARWLGADCKGTN